MTEEGYAISDHPEYSSIRDESEILANAKLIAAAPEMLDALRQMLACCYDLERNDETIAAVKAAMKAVLSATGETK